MKLFHMVQSLDITDGEDRSDQYIMRGIVSITNDACLFCEGRRDFMQKSLPFSTHLHDNRLKVRIRHWVPKKSQSQSCYQKHRYESVKGTWLTEQVNNIYSNGVGWDIAKWQAQALNLVQFVEAFTQCINRTLLQRKNEIELPFLVVKNHPWMVMPEFFKGRNKQ